MAQLAKDPEFQRRKQVRDAERQTRAVELAKAEEPIVADLHAAGVEVTSVWDLVNTSIPYPAALPVLLDHLQRGGYPDRVLESLGRALAVTPMNSSWPVLRGLYLRARGRGEEEGIAVALAASATADQLDGLIDLLGEDARGDTRILFLRPIKRLGGPRGRTVLESLTADPMFGKEARALLTTRPKLRARPKKTLRTPPEGG